MVHASKGYAFHLRLRDEKTVKGIFMMVSQSVQREEMIESDRQ